MRMDVWFSLYYFLFLYIYFIFCLYSLYVGGIFDFSFSLHQKLAGLFGACYKNSERKLKSRASTGEPKRCLDSQQRRGRRSYRKDALQQRYLEFTKLPIHTK
jgi:hypothetical protein